MESPQTSDSSSSRIKSGNHSGPAPTTTALTDEQFIEWIRQNFFAGLSDTDFGEQIQAAKDKYIQIMAYLDEHELTFSLETLNAIKDLVSEATPPSQEMKQQHGTPKTGSRKPETGKPQLPVTLDTVDDRLKSIEKKAFWALIILVIILFIK